MIVKFSEPSIEYIVVAGLPFWQLRRHRHSGGHQEEGGGGEEEAGEAGEAEEREAVSHV